MSEQKTHRSSLDWPTKASSPPSHGAMTCVSTAHIHVLGQKKLFYGNSQRVPQLHVPPAALSMMMLLGASAHQGVFFPLGPGSWGKEQVAFMLFPIVTVSSSRTVLYGALPWEIISGATARVTRICLPRTANRIVWQEEADLSMYTILFKLDSLYPQLWKTWNWIFLPIYF